MEQYDWIEYKEDDTDMDADPVVYYFSIDPNYDVLRTGKINIKSSGDYVMTKTASFSQEASQAFLSVGQDEFVLPYKHSTLKIPVDIGNYNTQYTIEIASGDQGWISWDEQSSTSDEVVLTLADNDQSDFPRDAEITIRNVNLTENVKIFQYGKPNPRIGDDLTAGILAFPGAEGGGRFTTGGRGGTVYHVTNLQDYDRNESTIPGSLRNGIDNTSGPVVIVFDVSGYIDLKRDMQITRPNVSIIGQTAPGDGITVRNYGLSIRHGVDNMVIRFIRSRPGDQSGGGAPIGSTYFENDAFTGRWFKNGIVDHVSGSWAIDETMSFYGVKDFTVQWAMTTESLNWSYHEKGPHGYGAMFSGDNATYHHSLIAHHSSRNPRVSALAGDDEEPGDLDNQGFSDMRNLVVYNWNGAGQGAYGGENNSFNWVNHYYKAGPATGTGYKSWRLMLGSTTSRIYADGSVATANADTYTDNWTYGIWDQSSFTSQENLAMKVDTPHPFSKVTTHSAVEAYDKVAKYSGASLRRDAVDIRAIEELLAGTANSIGSKDPSPRPSIIDTVSDAGGYPALKSLPALVDTDGDGIPDVWEDAYGLDKTDPNDALQYTVDP